MPTDINRSIGYGSYWGNDPNSKAITKNESGGGYSFSYGSGFDDGRKNDVDRYNQAASSSETRQMPGVAAYDYANQTLGRENGVLGQDAGDASSQGSYLNGLKGLAYGTGTNDAVSQANGAFAQGIANQRTAAASSPGGALAQASGLRNVSQSQPGLSAQNDLQNKSMVAQQQNQAQTQYLQGLSSAATGNASADAARVGMAGAYGQNATDQAGAQQRWNALNQNSDLFNQGLASQTNATAAGAYESQQDIIRQQAANRQAQRDQDNSIISKGVGVGTGALGGLVTGGTASDERAKTHGWDVVGMDDPNLRIGNDDRGYIAQNEESQRPSLASHFAPSSSAKPTKAKETRQGKARKMTDDELLAAADKEISAVNSDTARMQAEGPAVRYAGGGDKSNGYNTQLTHGAEEAYKNKFGTRSDRDYDLRGAFAAGLTDGANTQTADDGSVYFPNHLPDTYKKPNHGTFSNESQYAKDAPQRAGSWKGEDYIPAPGSLGDLVDPYRRKYPESSAPSHPLLNQGPEDDMEYGDWDSDQDLAYNQPARRGLAYGGARG